MQRRNFLKGLALVSGLSILDPNFLFAEENKPLSFSSAEKQGWSQLEEGLLFRSFETKKKAKYGNSRLSVLKTNLKHHDLVLLTAHELKNEGRIAPEWANEYDLVAVTNAGMFESNLQSTGYLKNGNYFNNPVFKENYHAFLAFNPKPNENQKSPLVQIIDKKCQPNYLSELEKYASISQSLRMINCWGQNVWLPQPKIWSIAALAVDKENHLLFLYSRSPYSVHRFNQEILALPLDLKQAMYLEGGPEASLYIQTPEFQFEGIGSYETGFNEDNDNKEFWPIPNVLGLKRKTIL